MRAVGCEGARLDQRREVGAEHVAWLLDEARGLGAGPAPVDGGAMASAGGASPSRQFSSHACPLPVWLPLQDMIAMLKASGMKMQMPMAEAEMYGGGDS